MFDSLSHDLAVQWSFGREDYRAGLLNQFAKATKVRILQAPFRGARPAKARLSVYRLQAKSACTSWTSVHAIDAAARH